MTLKTQKKMKKKKTKFSIRITDLIFFGWMFVGLLLVLIDISFILITIPDFIFRYWICLLIPIVIVKMFFPKSKFTTWMEKERW
jgi:hypothetical protein